MQAHSSTGIGASQSVPSGGRISVKGQGSPHADTAVAAGGGQPPYGHTGAVNTESPSKETEISIDWLEVTFKEGEVEGVLRQFTPASVELSEWAPLPCGRSGYRAGFVRGNVSVYYDGSEGMGVHVVAPGAGVDQLEAEGIVGGKWEGKDGYASRLLAAGASVSRIDVAMDDRSGLLTPERIQGAIDEGRVVSRFHYADPRGRINLADGSRGGWSVYLGANSSRVRVRFYDKAAEQAEKGVTVEGPWLRCEVQARNERGQWVLEQLAAVGPAAVAGLVFNYVQFKEPGDGDTNRSRWRACEWWLAFLGECEKRTCTVAQVVRSIEQVAEWFKRQVAPSFALLWHSLSHGEEWLVKALSQGSSRLKKWQLAALAVPAPQLATGGA